MKKIEKIKVGGLDYETIISTVEMQPKLTAGEGITIENNVISINYKNGDTEAY